MQHEVDNIHVHNIAIDDCFVEHGSVKELRKLLGLDAKSVTDVVRSYWNR